MSNWNKEGECDCKLCEGFYIADIGSEVSGSFTREIIMQMNNVAVADGNAI
jgi:hypothetical protein